MEIRIATADRSPNPRDLDCREAFDLIADTAWLAPNARLIFHSADFFHCIGLANDPRIASIDLSHYKTGSEDAYFAGGHIPYSTHTVDRTGNVFQLSWGCFMTRNTAPQQTLLRLFIDQIDDVRPSPGDKSPAGLYILRHHSSEQLTPFWIMPAQKADMPYELIMPGHDEAQTILKQGLISASRQYSRIVSH